MRIAVLSDIHGNLAALEAVLGDLAGRGVEGAYHLGDLVGFGPQPNEVIRRLRDEGIDGVAGNFDLGVSHPNPAEALQRHFPSPPPPAAVAALERARREVTDESLEFLGALPVLRRIEEGRQSYLFAHGSPDSVLEGLTDQTPESRLLDLFGTHGADVLVTGHTHVPLVRECGDHLLLNPGSVGRPLDGDPRAAYLVLDSEQGFSVEQVRVEFDVATEI